MNRLTTISTGGPVSRLRWHPTLQYLASGDFDRGEVVLWDVRNRTTPTPVFAFGSSSDLNRIWDLSFHPNGEIIAVASDTGLELWRLFQPNSSIRVASPTHLTSFPLQGRHDGFFSCAEFSPDGEFLLATQFPEDEIQVFGVVSGRYLGTGDMTCQRLAFHPDGTVFAATANGENGGEILFGTFNEPGETTTLTESSFVRWFSFRIAMPFQLGGIAFASGGDAVSVCGGWKKRMVEVLSFPSCDRTFQNHTIDSSTEAIDAIAWDEFFLPEEQFPDRVILSADGQELVYPSLDGEMFVSTWRNGEPATIRNQAHKAPVITLDCHPAFGLIATGGLDRKIVIWENGGMIQLPTPDSGPTAKDQLLSLAEQLQAKYGDVL
ncbi:MAG: WD40 repeat domain-containing protein [Gemmataceae bacterium]